jgi:putative hydrolase of the HAD superfamily
MARDGRRGVLLDYGDTLFTFRYERETHLRAFTELLRAAGGDPADAETLLEAFGPAFERAVSERDPDTELDYPLLIRGLLAAVNVFPNDEQMLAALEADHRAWDDARLLHPETLDLLDGLRDAGFAIAIVSNTFDPPGLMHGDLAEFGIGERVDAEIFSSELGYRKPHPEIYRHALREIGVEPTAALFAGDRVLEDVIGPSALGVRTCLCLYYRQDEGDHSLADFHAQTPLDVLSAAHEVLDTGV